jgi:DNA polymerase-3 subunit epsilon
MLAIFYDSETQSLPLWNEPSEHPSQPHIVQLAACLVDLETRKTISSLDVIVRPTNWIIPPDVEKIHGISTSYAHEVGIPEPTAVDAFLEIWRGRLRIAHNESFDARILRIALKRHAINAGAPDAWKDSPAHCTQNLANPIMKLPPTERMLATGRMHNKAPNLGEAYKHFTGKDLVGAHNAMTDVQACMAVYFAIQDHKGKT